VFELEGPKGPVPNAPQISNQPEIHVFIGLQYASNCLQKWQIA
jgi:hypothetical protein